MLRATSTLRDEMAVNGQSSLAVFGQILLSAHTHDHTVITNAP